MVIAQDTSARATVPQGFLQEAAVQPGSRLTYPTLWVVVDCTRLTPA